MKLLLFLAVLMTPSAFGASTAAPDKAQAAVMFRIVILPPVEETQLNAACANVPKGQIRVATIRSDGVQLYTVISP